MRSKYCIQGTLTQINFPERLMAFEDAPKEEFENFKRTSGGAEETVWRTLNSLLPAFLIGSIYRIYSIIRLLCTSTELSNCYVNFYLKISACVQHTRYS